MTRRGAALLLLGVAAYLAFLMAGAPATLLAKRLPSSITVGRLSGTLWRGAARPFAIGPLALKRLQWQLLPSGLVHGALRADLRAEGEALNGRGRVGLSFHELAATQLNAHAPLGPWMQLLQLPLRGVGHLQSENLSLRLNNSGLREARGTVTAHDVSVAGIGPLGDYRLTLAGTDGTIKGTLTTLTGPLQLRGVITVADGHVVTIDAVAQGRPDLNPAVMNSLRLAGRRRPDGTVQLHMQRDLSALLTRRSPG